MASVFAIGEFEFVNISLLSLGTQRQLELESRAGVDDVAVWDLGLKGMPFEVRTFAVADDLEEARELYKDYRDIVGDKVVIKFGDALEEQVTVLKVLPLEGGIRQIAGGLATNPTRTVQGICECIWHLISHPAPEI